ncbi:acetate--CoA ligase family protein [Micrococcus luteus]|uniref:acetate--CoA ligase family protein n=2 Tax=Bacillati TaxID=1783272 RepID=UPI000C79BB13|nr:acetate--CoA ligase family protein [Micrococcus luteus]MDK7330307.1 acetate--CoA ligase family protein [Micrococcus luteus]PLA41434.1 CoA-binding protein [Micrococcus luteus]
MTTALDLSPSQTVTGLEALFAPRAIAVVGASATAGKLGAVMAEAVSSYDAPIALVNPRAEGMHASIEAAAAALEVPLDLAILCVPAAATAQTLRAAAASGVQAALVCAGGFAEAGGSGVQYQQDVADVVRETGIRVLGPNTSGFFVPHLGLRASFVPGVSAIGAGPVGVISSSGGVNHAVSFRLQQAGVGVSLGVGLGAGIDVTAPDVIDYLAADPHTTAIALHIETVTDGPRMMEAICRATAVKPVVALVVGKNDVAEFAQSHTGALATSWRISRSVLRQCGAVLVDDETELVDAVAALARTRIPAQPDPGVGLVTGQAGPGLIIADHLAGAEVAVPRLTETTISALSQLLPPLTFQANPVDTGRPGPEFPEVVRAVADDPSIQAVGLYGILEPVVDLPAAVTAAGVEATPALIAVDGPAPEVAAVVADGVGRGLPVVTGPTALARGLTALVRDARNRYSASRPAVPAPAIAVGTGPWDEAQAKDLFEAAGIPVPTRARATTHEAARTAFTALRKPVAIKLVDAAVLHKTEIGGVHLGVTTEAQLEEVLAALDQAGAKEYLLEEMAPPGVDLVVGARRDPVFGPVVLLGLGGTAAEALADVALRAAPLPEGATESMVDELAGGALLRGWRGGPAVETGQLAHVLAALGATLAADPGIAEIEINPLRLTTSGLIALDAVIVATEQE